MILVTGAAGFIGSHLCERLLRDNTSVIGIDNFDSFYDPNIKRKNIRGFQDNPNFKLYEISITNIPDLEKVFARHQFSHIIHLAAKAGVRPSIAQPYAYKRTNIDGTLNLLEMARQHDIKRFILASSSSVYGNNKKVPYQEDDNVDFPISPYAATKKACELIAFTYHHLFDIHVHALRFFTVYGPRQRPEMAIHKFTSLIDDGEPIELYGYGKPKRDFTYIDDILQGIMSSIEKINGYEVINLGESATISTAELVQIIEQKLNKKAQIKQMEMQPGDVDITYADISKAKAILDYVPKTSIDEGIGKFVEWYGAEKTRLEKD